MLIVISDRFLFRQVNIFLFTYVIHSEFSKFRANFIRFSKCARDSVYFCFFLPCKKTHENGQMQCYVLCTLVAKIMIAFAVHAMYFIQLLLTMFAMSLKCDCKNVGKHFRKIKGQTGYSVSVALSSNACLGSLTRSHPL